MKRSEQRTWTISPPPQPKLGRVHWHQTSLQIEKQAEELNELHTSWDYVLHMLCNDLRIDLLPRINVGKKKTHLSFLYYMFIETYVVHRSTRCLIALLSELLFISYFPSSFSFLAGQETPFHFFQLNNTAIKLWMFFPQDAEDVGSLICSHNIDQLHDIEKKLGAIKHNAIISGTGNTSSGMWRVGPVLQHCMTRGNKTWREEHWSDHCKSCCPLLGLVTFQPHNKSYKYNNWNT